MHICVCAIYVLIYDITLLYAISYVIYIASTRFSTSSIVIEVCSSSSCDLTLIDLPGIIRTTTTTTTNSTSNPEQQKENVIEQVNTLINSYMTQPNTIILAVIPSNQDIATIGAYIQCI